MRDNSKVMRSFSMITQFTIHMLVPICMCSYGGYLLDKKFGTSFWFVLLFFIGALAGGRNVYRLAQKISDGDKYMPSEMYGSNQKKQAKKKADKKESR